MSLLHRHHAATPKADPDHPLTTADYDAQADLALAPHDPPNPGAFAPYAGELVQGNDHPGYDIERDISS